MWELELSSPGCKSLIHFPSSFLAKYFFIFYYLYYESFSCNSMAQNFMIKYEKAIVIHSTINIYITCIGGSFRKSWSSWLRIFYYNNTLNKLLLSPAAVEIYLCNQMANMLCLLILIRLLLKHDRICTLLYCVWELTWELRRLLNL